MEERQPKDYVQPAMDVVELEIRMPLLTDSPIETDGNINPWEDGGGGSGEIGV